MADRYLLLRVGFRLETKMRSSNNSNYNDDNGNNDAEYAK